jgi:glycosyltransferase involved in cell wall biosynthesis
LGVTWVPKISVIIPTYNRCIVLAKCLDALAAQAVDPASYEVVVVDDGSTDATATTVSGRAAAVPYRLNLLRQDNRGANAARNRGIAAARGPLLLIINDDTIAHRDLLRLHIEEHEREPAEHIAVLGRMTLSPEVPRTLFTDLHHDDAYRVFTGLRELDWTAFFTCNISVKRSFMRHGAFDEALRWLEDVELGQRLSRHGLRVLYNPDALGFHHHSIGEHEFLEIARKEGEALALWLARSRLGPEQLPVFSLSPSWPADRPLRHRLADRVLTPALAARAAALARFLETRHPRLATRLWRALFQRTKRRVMAEALKRRKIFPAPGFQPEG